MGARTFDEAEHPLSEQSCRVCRSGARPLSLIDCRELIKQLPLWGVPASGKLTREYSFPNYSQALSWVNKISEVAESENHHPDVTLKWGSVVLEIWTHTVGGLTENDFILAAKIDSLETT